MRNIKFRAKRIDGLGWVYGDLNQNPIHYKSQIIESGVILHSVIKSTIGQYIGLKNKFNEDIYEGDIIKGEFITVKGNGYGSPKHNKVEGVVEYIESSAQFAICTHITKSGIKGYKWFLQLHTMSEGRVECEIIGDIHENK